MMLTMPHAAAVKTATNDTTGTGSAGNTGGTGSTGNTDGSSGKAPSATSLGGADFLTLMLAQLKNQDPTNPVDSNTFLQQLAALSEVQGINGLQTSFATLSSSLSSGQALQASSLLGHQALVTSNSVTTTAAGTAVSGAIALPQTTGQLLLSITNSAGVLVRQINLGAQTQGNTSFSWDGKSGDGSQAPPDNYKLTATYQGQTKASTATSTYVNGIVESVSMGGGAGSTSGLTLNVAGVGSVPFSNVQQISN